MGFPYGPGGPPGNPDAYDGYDNESQSDEQSIKSDAIKLQPLRDDPPSVRYLLILAIVVIASATLTYFSFKGQAICITPILLTILVFSIFLLIGGLMERRDETKPDSSKGT